MQQQAMKCPNHTMQMKWPLLTSLLSPLQDPVVALSPQTQKKKEQSFSPSLEKNSTNFSYISFLGVNFENLIVKFHIFYVLNMHIKFCSNWILFTIWSINLFFIYNFILQKLEIITFIWWYSNWSLIFLKFCKH